MTMINVDNRFSNQEKLQIIKQLSKLKKNESINVFFEKSNVNGILKNEGFEADADLKENADIISGGINPQVALASLIAQKPYVYKSDFFGKKGNKQLGISDYIKVENKIDAISAGNGAYAGFFDYAVFRLQEENAIFNTLKSVRDLFGGRTGNQIPEVELAKPTDVPRYARVMNVPFSVKLSINQMENKRNIQMFGYNIADDKYQQLMKELQDQGEAQAKMTLFGHPGIGAQGLLNNNGIVPLVANDVSALGFGGVYKTLADISRNSAMMNIFTSRLGALRKGGKASGFDATTSYYSQWYNGGMEDPVLLIPRSDYANISRVSTANGGEMQNQQDFIARIEQELGIEVIPSPFVDCQNVGNDFNIADVANNKNTYILYDRAKVHTYITSPIGSMQYESTSFAGIQKDISVFGSRTDVFSFEKIFGFSFEVQQ